METILNPANVQRYFPDDISERLSHPLEFFGLLDDEPFQWNSELVRNHYLYLAAVAEDPGFIFQKSYLQSLNLDLRGEGAEFIEMRKKYPDLQGKTPLLILRLHNMTSPQQENRPPYVMELLRYADHPPFRKKGIATAVLDSLEKVLCAQEVPYLYANFNWRDWPKKSKVIPSSYASGELRKDLQSHFPEWFEKKSFSDFFHPGTFIKLTDPVRNEDEFHKAMLNYRDHYFTTPLNPSLLI